MIPGREIFTGRGGQNAQILIPISYRKSYGYINELLYKYYVRSTSHSHSINTAEKTIHQYTLFEKLVLETLKKMPDEAYLRYKSKLCRYYSRLRFGNALDTQDPQIISRYFHEMIQNNEAKLFDWFRFMKHTNFLLRSLFGK